MTWSPSGMVRRTAGMSRRALVRDRLSRTALTATSPCAIALVIVLSMVAVSVPAYAASESPVESVRFEEDPGWVTMVVTTQAEWTDWTLADPPRVILDLTDAVSKLPNAPSLYELEIAHGPVRRFRTSQFSNEPDNRRVRLTLELEEAADYEARRVGEEIHISVRRSGEEETADTPRQDLTATLNAILNETPAERQRAAASPPASGATAPVAASVREPESPRPPDTPGAPEDPKQPEVPGAPETEGGEAPSDAARTADVAGHGAATKDPDVDGTGAGQVDARANDNDTREASAGENGADTSDDTSADTSDDNTNRSSGKESDTGADAMDVMPEDLRHASAADRLLRESIASFLNGKLIDASGAAQRAAEYYGGSPSGRQAALLWHELRRVLDHPTPEYAGELPEVPNPERVPVEVMVNLIDRHLQKGAPAEAERLLAAWGPVYPRGEWTARLHLVLGEHHYLARRTDEALRHFAYVEAGDPEEAAALLMSARLHDEAGRTGEALELYRWLSRLPPGPEQERGTARAADLLFQRGDIREAARSYAAVAASETAPEDERAWAFYQSGSCALLLGRPEEAVAHWTRLVEDDSDAFWTPFAEERLESLAWRQGLAGVTQEDR